MSKPEPKGKFSVLEGLNAPSPANQQTSLTGKQENVLTANQQNGVDEKYARFSNYLRPDLHKRLNVYVGANKQRGVKLITAFNEAIEEYLNRRDA